ncbi:hypothetical protein T03_13745 [Trichinella britovi]|uniref:Uncharacterized protein n=2 Tax=Trichinella TaxID=6333 RepID=A0A0V0Z462_TRIBR|nr:hypothetical protein T05_13056 [Trichinella murrelli]KRY07335.1 hypothetical protein T03_13745 [Trichinella britovi]
MRAFYEFGSIMELLERQNPNWNKDDEKVEITVKTKGTS